ncbi:MAG: hypothetical protein M1160_01700 [Candidatus Marsarchaeota archaeon]|nr:hypothetical protein [Candidatus Marsarchaeota archaeon]MCL5111577.1 hypothetical protein [Candidatus Marsarchaeota archaeon]
MAQGKRTLRSARKSAQRQKQVTIIAPHHYIRGSESILIGRILGGEVSERMPESAVLFTSLLANLTPSLSGLSRRSGMRIGRHLYSMLSDSKGYLLYEESISDLVKFFEHAGYAGVMYNVFPDRLDMRMYDRSKEFLGINMHSFEAGVISGFATASRKQYVDVVERACSNNGSGSCIFSSKYDVFMEKVHGDAKAAIHRFVEHLARQTVKAERESEMHASPEYRSLAMSAVLERPYQDEIGHVASYIGSELASAIFTGKAKIAARTAAARIERVIRLLGIGKASVKSLSPIRIDVSFDRMHSRSEFVDISIALINGLLKNHIAEGAKVTRVARRGAYLMRITGKAAE